MSTRIISAVILIAFAVTWHLPAASAADGTQSQANEVIGLIGSERLTISEVVAADATEFNQLASDYDREQHRLQLKYAKSRYDLLQKQLDGVLDQRALEAEAKARGISTSAVLEEFKPDNSVTDAQARAFYELHKDQISDPYDQAALKIRLYLATQHNETATRTFYDALRAKHGIRAQLEPYSIEVAASGPSRGQSNAPVTIVEFGDFQCPYCREAEGSLRSLLTQYPRQVRLVFRHLPLSQIHPNAQVAAEAAICADRQGHFWPMHDAMYADQKALGPDGLKTTAQRLGLDTTKLATCMSDPATDESIAADVKAADNLGISGTPFFFINGRPLDGSVPIERFQEVIDSELHRLDQSATRR